eukprot:CAMPEP_0118924448 /NCGR_PEP_ID=MMETSP1169-20130426/2579_1 /TAXON_ID=36882 /ORGANISM="Pyramimonas obovata, Strain CCMP722" /LENGTH=383 /DNA_ID=CAMNT_0006865565 /DNA_START=83 /DNA_END=1231 /DNA_ORIENTATION=+
MSCVGLPRVAPSAPKLAKRLINPALTGANHPITLGKQGRASHLQLRCGSTAPDQSLQWPSAREPVDDHASMTSAPSTSTSKSESRDVGHKGRPPPKASRGNRGARPKVTRKTGPDAIDVIVEAILAQEDQADVGEAVGAKPLKESWLTTLLTRVSNKGGVRPAMRVFQWAHAQGYDLNAYHYTAVVSVLGKNGKWQDAVQLLDLMKGASVAPTVHTYSVLITCLNKAGEWERSLAMFEEMRQTGLEPDAINLTAFFSACEKGGECSRALKVLEEARAAGVALDAMAYATLVSACGKAGRFAAARAVFDRMLLPGSPVQPTPAAYNALLEAAARDAGGCKLEEVERIVAEMGAGGVAMDTTTLNTLLNAFVRAGHFPRALAFFK